MNATSPCATLAAGSCGVDLSNEMVEDHKLLPACGTDRTAHSPLEDGTWAPAVAPRVTKAATKGRNRTILFTSCVLSNGLRNNLR